MRRSTSLLCLLILAVARPAHSKVMAMSIEDLAHSSDEILIAKVTQVSGSSIFSGNVRYATAEVQRSLKGSLTGTFRFLASPTWTCDVSDAEKGEVVLLFLVRDKRHKFVIAHSGRGRMPLRSVGAKTCATLWGDVWLPKGAPVIAGPDQKYDFIVSVELSYLEDIVSKKRGTKTAA